MVLFQNVTLISSCCNLTLELMQRMILFCSLNTSSTVSIVNCFLKSDGEGALQNRASPVNSYGLRRNCPVYCTSAGVSDLH